MTAAHRPGSGPLRAPEVDKRFADPLDGRLDLDHLDAPQDLDVIGEDPDHRLVSERLNAALDRTSVGRWTRRHRRGLLAGTLAAALVVTVGTAWQLTRPVPLPDEPRLLIKSSGPDRTQVTLGVRNGAGTALTESVAVASVERRGVRVELLGLTGPGLAPARGAATLIDTTKTDEQVSVSATLDCAAPGSSEAVLAASADDYAVEVRRTAPEGETRVDPVPLVGSQQLLQLVARTCLEQAAARDLEVVSATATRVPGLVGADLDLTVANTSGQAWHRLRVSTLGLPSLVKGGTPAEVGPHATGHVLAQLYPQDCGQPIAALADGLEVRAAATSGAPPAGIDNGPTFRVPVSRAALAEIARAFTAACASPTPGAVVEQAIIHGGSGASSGGLVELVVRMSARDAVTIVIDSLGRTASGMVTAIDNPVQLTDGEGVLHAMWLLPRCIDLLSSGPPRLSVALVGFSDPGVRRPYLVDLSGEALRVALARLCGETATALIRQ